MDKGSARCDMPTSGAARGDNFVWVYSEFFCVGADPANGGFGIFGSVEGGGFVSASDAVFCGVGYHAELGEILCEFVELFWGAAVPAASEEEDDGGTFLGGLVPFGIKGVQLELHAIECFVCELFVWSERGECLGEGKQYEQHQAHEEWFSAMVLMR